VFVNVLFDLAVICCRMESLISNLKKWLYRIKGSSRKIKRSTDVNQGFGIEMSELE